MQQNPMWLQQTDSLVWCIQSTNCWNLIWDIPWRSIRLPVKHLSAQMGLLKFHSHLENIPWSLVLWYMTRNGSLICRHFLRILLAGNSQFQPFCWSTTSYFNTKQIVIRSQKVLSTLLFFHNSFYINQINSTCLSKSKAKFTQIISNIVLVRRL